MAIELEVCRSCNKVMPKSSMSRVDNTICVRCSAKLIARAELADGSWYDDALALGIKPWEQFPNEPRHAYNALRTLLDAYPNDLSYRQLAEKAGVGEAAVRHWSKRWRWKDRSFEWCKKRDKELLVEQANIKKEMNYRQIDASRNLMDKAMSRIENIDMDELTPKEVLSWVEVASKIERKAVESNAAIVEAEVENRAYSVGTVQKADAQVDSNKGLNDVLAILTQAGAINISTTVSAPKAIEQESQDADYESVDDE